MFSETQFASVKSHPACQRRAQDVWHGAAPRGCPRPPRRPWAQRGGGPPEDVLPKVKNAGKVIQFPAAATWNLIWRPVCMFSTCGKNAERPCLCVRAGGLQHGSSVRILPGDPVGNGHVWLVWNTAGKHCNFLHAFGHPNNEFGEANRDLSPDGYGSSFCKSSEGERTGHHLQHHGRPRGKPGLALFCKRSGEAERKGRSRHGGRKSHRHTAKSRESHSSRSRERKRDHSRGPGSGSWSRSLSPSGSRSPHGRRSGSRDRTINSPQSKQTDFVFKWSHMLFIMAASYLEGSELQWVSKSGRTLCHLEL